MSGLASMDDGDAGSRSDGGTWVPGLRFEMCVYLLARKAKVAAAGSELRET